MHHSRNPSSVNRYARWELNRFVSEQTRLGRGVECPRSADTNQDECEWTEPDS